MRILAMATAVLLLAACSGPSEPVQGAVDGEKPAATAATPVPQPTSQDAITAAVATLGGKVKVRYDRVGKNADGAEERQVFMEVVSGTVKEAETIMAAQLTTAGYKQGHRFEDGNGARQLYRTRTGLPIRSLARPKGVGPALKDPQATGSIYLKQ